MKKTIKSMLIFMVLLVSIVSSAIYSPMPINGRVTGDFINGLTIEVTNLRTSDVQKTTTSSIGEFIVDAANFKTEPKYIWFDKFKIEITNCVSNPDCVKTVTYEGQDEIFSIFDIGDSVEPPEPECVIDSDCPISYKCISEECVYSPPEPEPECTSNSDCPISYVCESQECVYVEPEVEFKDIIISTNDNKSIASIEVDYCQNIDVVVKKNKLNKLQDKEIDFNRKDYDIHEEIILRDMEIKTSLYDSDYGTRPYIIVPEESIEYRYVFDKGIPLDEIDYDEPLEIKFMGEDYTIISASENKITIEKGELETNLKIGDKVPFDGKNIEIISIGYDDGTYVYVSYNGDKEQIFKGDIGKVGGIQILAEDIIDDPDVADLVDLKIAEEIEIDIINGEDYEDGEDYKWIISLTGSGGYIGITNQEDYKYLDDEEENSPLTVMDKIVLPNNFATIKFNEITDTEITDINFKVKENYLYVRGNEGSFVYNNVDYDTIYIDSEGIYDTDKDLISTDKIRIGDSTTYLKLAGNEVEIRDLSIKLDMSDILYNGESYDEKEDTYVDCYGMVFKDPDKAIKDKYGFQVEIPEERIKGTLTIGKELDIPEMDKPESTDSVEPDTEPDEPGTEKPILDDPVEPDPVEPTPDPIVEPKPKPVEPTDPVEPAETSALFKILISLAIAILGFVGWGKGFVGLANYWFNKGKEYEADGNKVEANKCYDRAAKMLRTALKRVEEDKYK